MIQTGAVDLHLVDLARAERLADYNRQHDAALKEARAAATRAGTLRRQEFQADQAAKFEAGRVGSLVPGETFIDWIEMAQRHPFDVPLVGEGIRLKGKALDTVGEVDGKRLAIVELGEDGHYSVPSLQHRGSFATSLMIRSDGRNVGISGNPGRFNRPDNIWNYGLDDTVAKVNSVLAAHALPPFSPGECHTKERVSERDAQLGLFDEWTGAVCKVLHVTRNFAAGNDMAGREVLRAFRGRRAARLAKGSYGEETVVFGDPKKQSTSKLIVCYRKAEEMLAHAGKGKGVSAAERKEARRLVEASQEYQMARDTGLVRVELKLGRQFLRDNGLRFLGAMTMEKIISIFNRETRFLLDASPDQCARLVSDLDRKLRLPALAWIRGEDVKSMMSRATFYRTRKALMESLNIDISEPRDVHGRPNAEEALQRHIDALPRFELRPLSAPEWYGLPEIRRAA